MDPATSNYFLQALSDLGEEPTYAQFLDQGGVKASNLSKFERVGMCGAGPCYWRQRHSDGSISYYGGDDGSWTSWPPAPGSTHSTRGAAFDAAGRGIRAWALRRHVDVDGNSFVVTYHDSSPLLLPITITYSVHGTNTAVAATTVTFRYVDRSDKLAGPLPLSVILRDIGTVSRDPDVGAAAESCTQFEYEASPTSGRSRLTSVSFGRTGCASPTKDDTIRLAYNDETSPSGLTAVASDWGDWDVLPPNLEHWASDSTANFARGDFNGDGFADVLRTRSGLYNHSVTGAPPPAGTSGWVYMGLMLGSPTGLQPEFVVDSRFRPQGPFVDDVDVADIDLDGYDDVFFHSIYGDYEIAWGGPLGLQPNALAGRVVPEGGFEAYFMPGDFDNDNHKDFAFVEWHTGVAHVLRGFSRTQQASFDAPARIAWAMSPPLGPYCNDVDDFMPSPPRDCVVGRFVAPVVDIDDDGFDDLVHWEHANLRFMGPPVVPRQANLTVLRGGIPGSGRDILSPQSTTIGLSYVPWSPVSSRQTGASLARKLLLVAVPQQLGRSDYIRGLATFEPTAGGDIVEHVRAKSSGLSIPMTGVWNNLVGDTNGDGLDDVVNVYRSGKDFVVDRLQGTSSGRFGGIATPDPFRRVVDVMEDSHGPWDSTLVDINGDGLRDIVLANYGDARCAYEDHCEPFELGCEDPWQAAGCTYGPVLPLKVDYFLGQADGRFKGAAGGGALELARLETAPVSRVFVSGDFNGDGVDDFLLANRLGGRVPHCLDPSGCTTTPDPTAASTWQWLSGNGHADRLREITLPTGGTQSVRWTSLARSDTCAPAIASNPGFIVAAISGSPPERAPAVSPTATSNNGPFTRRASGGEIVVCSISSNNRAGLETTTSYHFDRYISELRVGPFRIPYGAQRMWAFDEDTHRVSVTDFEPATGSAAFWSGITSLPVMQRTLVPAGQWSGASPQSGNNVWEVATVATSYTVRASSAVPTTGLVLPHQVVEKQLVNPANGDVVTRTITHGYDNTGSLTSVLDCRDPTASPVSRCVETRYALSHDLANHRLGRVDQERAIAGGVLLRHVHHTYDAVVPWRRTEMSAYLFKDADAAWCSGDWGSPAPCAAEVASGQAKRVVLARWSNFDAFGQAQRNESTDGFFVTIQRDPGTGTYPTVVTNSEGHTWSLARDGSGRLDAVVEGVGAQSRTLSVAAGSVGIPGTSAVANAFSVLPSGERALEYSQATAGGASSAGTLKLRTLYDGFGQPRQFEKSDDTGSYRDVSFVISGVEQPPYSAGAPIYNHPLVKERFVRRSGSVRCGLGPCVARWWTETWYDSLGRTRATYELDWTPGTTNYVRRASSIAQYESLTRHSGFAASLPAGARCTATFSPTSVHRECEDAWGRLLARGSAGYVVASDMGAHFGKEVASPQTSAVDEVGFKYGASGQLLRAVDRQGVALRETRFDSWGRLLDDFAPRRGWVRRTLTDSGKILSETHNATTRVYAHDSLGRLRSITANGSLAASYTYDEPAGGNSQAKLTTAATTDTIESLVYRPDGHLSRRSVAFRGSLQGRPTWQTDYDYDSSGRLWRKRFSGGRSLEMAYAGWDLDRILVDGTEVVRFSAADGYGPTRATTPLGVEFTKVRDGFGRLVEERAQKAGTVLAGRVVSRVEGSSVVRGVSDRRASTVVGGANTSETAGLLPDALNRLAEYAPVGAAAQSLGYTAFGTAQALPDRTMTYGSCGIGTAQVTGTSFGAAYSSCWDSSGRIASLTIAGAAESFTFDALDRLTLHTNGITQTRSAYLATGGRLLRTQVSSGKTARTFYLDPDFELVEEGSGTTSSVRIPGWGRGLGTVTQGTLTGRPSAASLVSAGSNAMSNDTLLGRPNGALYFVRDQVGSVTDVVDANGVVVSRYRRDPFGARRSVSRGTDVEPSDLMGSVRDARTGLVHMGSRVYDTRLGSFLSRDPRAHDWLADNQRVDEYGLSAQNPANYVDSAGEAPYDYWDESTSYYGPQAMLMELMGSEGFLLGADLVPVTGGLLMAMDGKEIAVAGMTKIVLGKSDGEVTEGIGRLGIGALFVGFGLASAAWDSGLSGVTAGTEGVSAPATVTLYSVTSPPGRMLVRSIAPGLAEEIGAAVRAAGAESLWSLAYHIRGAVSEAVMKMNRGGNVKGLDHLVGGAGRRTSVIQLKTLNFNAVSYWATGRLQSKMSRDIRNLADLTRYHGYTSAGNYVEGILDPDTARSMIYMFPRYSDALENILRDVGKQAADSGVSVHVLTDVP